MTIEGVTPPRYVLGLDLGETSVGWALVAYEGEEPQGIIDLGARVFPPGADVDERKGTATTLNQARREHRSARRNIRRRKDRKEKVRSLLRTRGFWPDAEGDEGEFLSMNPYRLRAMALDSQLSPEEFGRAIYNLAVRRGFKSNRKTDAAESDTGTVKEGIARLSGEVDEAGARTLGEFLWSLHQDEAQNCRSGVSIRNKGADYKRVSSRRMLEEEFEKIWTAQTAYHTALHDADFKESLYQAIFYQRPFELTAERLATMPSRANAQRAPSLAKCPLFQEEYRCSLAAWKAQRFRILKEIGDLRVVGRRGEFRFLTDPERTLVLSTLESYKKVTFKRLRKDLELSELESLNLERGKRDYMDGNEVEATLKGVKGFGKRWKAFDEDQRQGFRHLISNSEDEEQFLKRGLELGATKEELERIRTLRAPDGYLRYSEKALGVLLPYMNKGLDEHKALQAAREDGLLPATDATEEQPFLPAPEDLPNPIVMRTLHQMRKVVNAIIREWGKPWKIRVELARDLKNSGKQREEAASRRRDNEKRNDEAREFFQARGHQRVGRDDLLKYRLWHEQGMNCAYTGKPISDRMLTSDQNEVELDHIIPFSRSVDDSYMNKVLVATGANRDKGNQTPHEWLSGPDGEGYKGLLVRLGHMREMPDGKKRRFMLEDVDLDHNASRKLVDTRYISVQAAGYLALLYSPSERDGQKRVQTTSGQATAMLRHHWGANVLSADGQKTRDDHRHHAVDAVITACAERRHMLALANSHSGRADIDAERVHPPWISFRKDVEWMLLKRPRTWKIGDREITTHGTLVSHRVEKRIMDGLHKQSNYGISRRYLEEWGEKLTHAGVGPAGNFKKRIGVEGLNPKKLAKAKESNFLYICDETILKIIVAYCDEHAPGWEKLKGFKRGFFDGLTMPSGVPIRKVRTWYAFSQPAVFMDASGRPYRVVELGNNHRIDFFEKDKGDGRPLTCRVVPMLTAANELRRGTPAVAPESYRKLMSLHRGEMLFIDDGSSIRPTLVRVLKISGSMDVNSPSLDLSLVRHNDARPSQVITKESFGRIASLSAWTRSNVRKVVLSPIGQVIVAHD